MSTVRRAVGLREFGGPDVLQVVELPVVEPDAGEVMIRVAAAAVNPTDTGLRTGARREQLTWDPPYVPGMDAAGVVEAVGAGVDLAVGDRVMAVASPMRPEGGAYTELLTVPAAQVAPVPTAATLAQAATLPMNGLTAKITLDALDLRPGQRFGVTGAAGVLGGYAIALARHRGLTVVADAAPYDEDLVRASGADVIVARGDDVGARMRAVTDGGVDGLLDAALLHTGALAGVRDGGGLAAVRQFRGDTERGITIHRIRVFDHLGDREGLQLLHDLAGAGALQLRVAGTFAPEDAAVAHERFASGGVRGRFLIAF